MLDLHGWGGLQDELNGLSKQGRWADMGDLIDDELLNTFAVVAGNREAVARSPTAGTATSSSASRSTPPTAATPSAGPASSTP